MCVFSGIQSWTHATEGFVSGLQPEGASSAYLEWASDGPSGNDFSTAHRLGMIHITLTHKHVHTHFPMQNYLLILSLFIVYFQSVSLFVITHTVCVQWHSQQAVGDQWPSCLSRTHWDMWPALQQHFPNIRETLALSPISKDFPAMRHQAMHRTLAFIRKEWLWQNATLDTR